MRNELRAIVHAQMGRDWIELEQSFDRVDHSHSLTAETH